jgi:hypothetical protein
MSFAEFTTKQFNTNFKKTEFVNFSQGEHFIRIISETPVMFNTHFTHMITFKCLGDDCPVCQNNLKLRMENPKAQTNQIVGFIPRRQLAYVNVLDRTTVKVCPNCGNEVKKYNGVFPPSCAKCNAVITTVQSAPLNKVKVMSKGKEFFDQVNFYANTIVDENTETPLGINNFDLSVLITAPKAKPVVGARPDRNDPITVNEDDLYDLNRAIITLNAEEIRDVLRGTSIRDIFASRKEMKTQDASPEVLNQMTNMFEA